MKTTILCLIGAASVMRVTSIPEGDMHNFEANDGVTNWRKAWP